MEMRKHPATNHTLGAPSDMTSEECSALPVIAFTDEHGPWMQSFWQPSAEELTMLNAGGSVVLQVRAAGRAHPVVVMGVTADETEAV